MSAIALSAAALAAAGCSSSATAASKTTTASASQSGSPAASGSTSALTTAQAQSIFKSVTSQLASGNQKTVLAATGGVSWHEETFDFFALHHSAKYQYEKPSFFVPSQDSAYPRWFAVTTDIKAPKDAPSSLAGVSRPASGPALLTFEKMGPQTPWQLTTSMRLQDGQKVPAMSKTPDIAALDDTTSYLVRPDLVGPLQASVVDDGPRAPATSAVADGPLTTGIYSHEAAIKPPAGDVRQWALQGGSYDRFALRLANGGALVFFSDALDETTEVPSVLADSDTVRPGRVIPVPAAFKALIPLHETHPTVKLETEYDLDFAAIDPPASAKNGKIQVIAMGGVPTYADARSTG